MNKEKQNKNDHLALVFAAVLLIPFIVLLFACSGCRTVTVYEVPGGGPVYVNQSYAPDISLLSGLDTNVWRAIAQGAAAGVTK